MKYPLIEFSQLVVKELLSRTGKVEAKDKHLQAAVDWLKLAHDKANSEGVSYGYSIKGGWREPYRETTGYIAVTFFNLATFLDDKGYYERAIKMCDWELKVQNNDGSISNPKFYPDQGIVFDTGQVLFGLVRAYKESKNERYLKAGIRAAQWLVDVSDDNDRWTRCTHKGIPHVYNSRVAWAMLLLNQINPEEKWLRVAKANLDFAVEQLKNGWFEQCAFETGKAPFTHTIAYAIRGLYEASQILDEVKYLSAADEVSRSCISKMKASGFIPGQIDTNGNTIENYCCLTGNCQLSIIWAKMFKLTGDKLFKEAAVSALKYVMKAQILDTGNGNYRGAIAGSLPIWGPYSRLTFPNWPTKFFIDAMIECWEWLD